MAVKGDKGSRWRVGMRWWREDEGVYMIVPGFGNRKTKSELQGLVLGVSIEMAMGWGKVAR